jgi:hypothetical protein
MKLRSTLALSLLALAAPLFAGSAKPDDEKAVLAAEKQYADAMLKHDVATLDKLLADDLEYTHSSVLIQSKADVIEGVKSGKTNYKAIEFKTTKVKQYGNTVITIHNMIFAQPERSNNVYVTMVWAKTPRGWQMVQRQATRYPEDAAKK